jgi:hypothetical protein
VHRDVRQLLERWGVTSLRSPPLTPTYNGAVEAGMGSLKARIAAIAAQHGRATAWTHDDLDAALCAQRACGAPRGATASPDEAWRARVSIPPEERQRFLEALEVARESLLRDSPPSPIIERKAVRNVLTELTYLIIRRP